MVVNWFQIVFLREDSQVALNNLGIKVGCELISNCIFTWGFTRRKRYDIGRGRLWIDFKLYFYVRIHKEYQIRVSDHSVVNWFQIVFLREDSQVYTLFNPQTLCCELISNCIFTWGFTRRFVYGLKAIVLWIDFKLYFYVRIHKPKF